MPALLVTEDIRAGNELAEHLIAESISWLLKFVLFRADMTLVASILSSSIKTDVKTALSSIWVVTKNV